MSIPIYQADAFVTERPFSGNPAGVCLLPGPRGESWMKDVAAEMNLSETAFLVPRGRGFDLRWFTPTVEVELCGHATFASSHILWESGVLPEGQAAEFYTKSGTLTATQSDGLIELDLPALHESAAVPPADLLSSLGVKSAYIGQNKFDYLVEVESAAIVRAVRPDFLRLRTLGVRGVILTGASDTPEFDVVSRFFAPGAGIDEDPVTGSAHSCLGPFWAKRLGKNTLMAYQASPRGGVLRLNVRGDRVLMAGRARTFFRGKLA